ncbi:MauE/DoxX family redox-associated membrane protein [Streptomyces kunmingensis]|uniref:MauE/DoxX family redox-associated membrane protein n=1 Tax=Streptomyces kunmingensis TaxID=68225 RepID=UPI003CD0760D
MFLASAVSKTSSGRSFRLFLESVGNMPLVPPTGVRLVALGVIFAEISILVLLLWPSAAAQAVAFLVAAGLLAVFALSIAVAIRRGATTPCRCFGSSAVPLGMRHLLRNLVLAGFAGLGTRLVLDPGEPMHPGGAVIAAVSGAVLAALIAALDDIVELYRPAFGFSGHRPKAGRWHPSHKEIPHAVPVRGSAARGDAVRPEPSSHPGGDQAVA